MLPSLAVRARRRVALASPLLAGCGALGRRARRSSSRSVVTSFYPLQYVAQRIVGDHADGQRT